MKFTNLLSEKLILFLPSKSESQVLILRVSTFLHQNQTSMRTLTNLNPSMSTVQSTPLLYSITKSTKHSNYYTPSITTTASYRNPRRLRTRSIPLVAETAITPDSLKEQLSYAAKSVTRRLILLRHAKSSWGDSSLRDHDRPLSKAGRADAVKVSQKLQDLGWVPQLILSSDAARTRETLKIMQEHMRGLMEAELHFISSFYSIAAMDGQTADHLQQAICNYSRDDILTVMCMGHNRGWEEAASMFTGASVELKTCNAALLEAAGSSWEEAFALAGHGGWKLQGIVTPST